MFVTILGSHYTTFDVTSFEAASLLHVCGNSSNGPYQHTSIKCRCCGISEISFPVCHLLFLLFSCMIALSFFGELVF